VLFDGRPVSTPTPTWTSWSSATRCSIHKSQGSEYAAVVIPLHTQHTPCSTQPALHGITRGRRLVVVVGSRKPRRSRAQQPVRERHTRLAERLAEAHPGPGGPAL